MLLQGIGARLAVSFLLVVMLVLLPSLFWFYHYAQSLTESRIQHTLRSVLEHDYSLLQSSVENRDHWQLFHLVRSMASPEHIVSVAVVDHEGQLLAHSNPQSYSQPNLQLLITEGYERIPIEGMRGLLGELLILRDDSVLRAYFAPVKRGILLVSLAFALLAGGLGIVVAWLWRRRLDRILALTDVRPGDLLLQPQESQGDELDQLEQQLIFSIEQLRISRWILDSVKESVLLVDESGKIHHANLAARTLCQCEGCQHDLLHMLDPEAVEAVQTLLRQRVVTSIKVQMKVCDQAFPALLSCRHYEGLDSTGMVVVTISDLSDLERLQGRMEKLRALSLMGEMSTEVTHEIRNDLAPVKLLCETAEFPEEDRQIMLASLNRIDGLIDSFMSFVRGKQQPQEYRSLCLLMQRSCDVLKSLAQAQKVHLSLQVTDQEVLIRAGAFSLVVVNLVRNALQAVDQGGHVWVVADVNEEGLINLVVEDDGPGIPAALRDDIFEPFVSFREGGTGMGLALVLRHVDEAGGKVVCQERSAGGTLFKVSWPLAEVHYPALR